jgi:hypothetical protein
MSFEQIIKKDGDDGNGINTSMTALKQSKIQIDSDKVA